MESNCCIRGSVPSAGLFAMLMEVADRYILKILTNLETVGIYSAGYKVGVLMLLIANAFNMGWQPYFLGKKADFYDGTCIRE